MYGQHKNVMKIVLRHQGGCVEIITLFKGYPEKVRPQNEVQQVICAFS